MKKERDWSVLESGKREERKLRRVERARGARVRLDASAAYARCMEFTHRNESSTNARHTMGGG